MKMLVTHRKITLSILMMMVVLGVQNVGYSQAVCNVGDIIQPGESCTYPGTEDVFSVDDAGKARFLFFTAGGNLILRDSNINGKPYTLVTEHSAGGGRRITELGGDTAPPEQPVDDDTRLIPDPNLAAAIREVIGNSITRQTLLNLMQLDAPNSEITDLTGLEHARNLRELNLGSESLGEVNSNAISDFSPISGLTRLTSLKLTSCGLSDVSFLSGLRQLTSLDLGNNSISDISPLANLKQLTRLILWNNNISDISPLAELKKLTRLAPGNNTISDISPLAELKNLTWLWLGGSAISDISPLAELKNLTDLTLHYNSISDVSPLAGLTKLTDLWLGVNSISDVSPLAGLTKLNGLGLQDNNISDIFPLVKLNLTGTRWGSTGLDIRRNPLNAASITTHIPAMRAKGIVVAFEDSTVLTQEAGEKIVGPWLWVIAPTGRSGGL